MRSETLRLRNGTGTPFGNLRPRKEGHCGYLQTVAQVHENSVATVSSLRSPRWTRSSGARPDPTPMHVHQSRLIRPLYPVVMRLSRAGRPEANVASAGRRNRSGSRRYRTAAKIVGALIACSAITAQAQAAPPGAAAIPPVSTVTISPASTIFAEATSGTTPSLQTADTLAPPSTTVASGPIRCVSPLTLDKRDTRWLASNLIMVGIPIRSGARARALVQRHEIAGILVRGAPRAADATLLRSIRDARSDMPTIVAVDEEGGRVQHLAVAVGKLPSAKTMAATRSSQQIRALIKAHGIAMRKLGFTFVFGPVLDLQFGPDKGGANGIGDRAFSADPAVVTEYATAFAQGMLDAGIYPVVKHFPGGGRANGDPHYKGTVSPSIEELRALDLIPFANLVRTLPIGVMTGHQQVPGLDSLPASLSPKAVGGVLRKELGFNGLAITDSLSMWSIAFNFNRIQAATLALKAGNDILLFDDEPDVGEIIRGLTDAIEAEPKLRPRLVNAATNVLRAKGIPLCAGAPSGLPTSTTSVAAPTVTTTF